MVTLCVPEWKTEESTANLAWPLKVEARQWAGTLLLSRSSSEGFWIRLTGSLVAACGAGGGGGGGGGGRPAAGAAVRAAWRNAASCLAAAATAASGIQRSARFWAFCRSA